MSDTLNTQAKSDLQQLKQLNDSLHSKIQLLEKEDMSIKYINAIGAQWPLVLIILIAMFFILYRRKIEFFFGKTQSIKGTAAGVSVEITQSEARLDIINEIEIATNNSKDNSNNQENSEVELTKSTTIKVPQMYDTYLALKTGSEGEAIEILTNLQLKEIDELAKERNNITFQYFKYISGYPDAINEILLLKELSPNVKTKIRADYFISLCYIYSQNYNKAIESISIAIEECEKQREFELKIDILVKVSEAYEKNDLWKEYVHILIVESRKELNEESLYTIYKKIAEVYNKQNKDFESVIFLLKANQYHSNDIDLLFSIAYRSSQVGFNEIALQFYELINKLKKNQTSAINNLAVAYDRLDVKSKAVSLYSKSYELGNSLAASNLAYKYLHVGFTEEAKKILDDVKSHYDNIDSNIWKAYDKLEEDIKSEKDKTTEIYRKSLLVKTFFEYYSDGIIKNIIDPSSISLSEYVWDNHVNNVKVNYESMFISIDLDDTDLKIHMPKDMKKVGECSAIESNKPGKPFKSESYKGHYCVNDDKLKILIKYDYYSIKQEILLLEFTETKDVMTSPIV